MEIITDCIQGSPEWHSHRLGSTGASSANKILAKGKGRHDHCIKLAYEIITGKKQGSYSDKTMSDGLKAEPFIRNGYEFVTGNEVNQVALILSDLKRVHCSPDGLIGLNGGLEIKKRIITVQTTFAMSRKYPDMKYGTKLHQGIPEDSYAQIQHSLWVSEREWWDYTSACVAWDDKDEPFFELATSNYMIIQRVERDEPYIATIEKETILFLEELNVMVDRLR